jgi:hypothetical protein
MVVCKLGRPIDDARILKHEKLYHHLVRKHISGLNYLPGSMAYEDLINACRYEAYLAIQAMDPELALTSKIKNDARRQQKLAEKRANPEKAFEQAERNLIYWRIDNYLKRLKWNHGMLTAPLKRRGVTVSLESVATAWGFADASDPDAEAIISIRASLSRLSETERHNIHARYEMLLWCLERGGRERVQRYLSRLSDRDREHLLEYVQLVAIEDRGKSSGFLGLVPSAPEEEGTFTP